MGKIPKTYNGWEAYGYLFSSLWYLLRHPQYGVVLYAIAGGLGFNELSHYTGIQIVVGEKAEATKVGAVEYEKPDNGGLFSLPSAYAQEKKGGRSWKSENAIIIDSLGYGFKDMNFKIFKKEDADEILIYYVPNRFGRWHKIDHELFDPAKYRDK